jgi:hypothetical protein
MNVQFACVQDDVNESEFSKTSLAKRVKFPSNLPATAATQTDGYL